MGEPTQTPTFWGFDNDEHLSCTDRDEAIDEYLDNCYPGPYPETLEVIGFVRRKADPDTWRLGVLDRLLENLDEEYGDPDGGPTDPTPAMKEAEQTFVSAVLAEYEVWQCERCCEETVDVREWIAANRPDWLEEVPRG